VKVHFRRAKRKTQIYGDYDDEGAKANMKKMNMAIYGSKIKKIR